MVFLQYEITMSITFNPHSDFEFLNIIFFFKFFFTSSLNIFDNANFHLCPDLHPSSHKSKQFSSIFRYPQDRLNPYNISI